MVRSTLVSKEYQESASLRMPSRDGLEGAQSHISTLLRSVQNTDTIIATLETTRIKRQRETLIDVDKIKLV